MLVGYLMLGVVPVLVRALRAEGFSSPETVAVRFGIACLAVPLFVRWLRQPLRTRAPGLLLLRGLLGGVAVLMYFTSVQLAGAGTGTLLNYTYPLWANLLGVFFGQAPRRSFWPLLVIAMVGVYLVVDPALKGVGLGEALGLGSATAAGAAVLCIKKLRHTDGELVIVAAFSGIGLMLALPALGLFATPAGLRAWSQPRNILMLLGVGGLSFLGHVYFTRGYRHTSLQLGTILSLSVPVVASLLGWLVLGELMTLKFLLGAGLIGVACVLLAVGER